MGISGGIGGIQPFAELAQNGTTLVYKGYDRSLDRFVLLKVLRPEYSQDEALAQRFEDEARLIARVQHPNVVAIYSYGQEEHGSYMVAEFVEGIDLRALVEQGRLPVELAAFVLLEAASGLQAAHGRGILHRDIKPANLLVSHEGQVKLADFGMASLLSEEAEEVRGTLAYLAPEQVRGEQPCKASDLFSLGATFYEMLTGRPAFTGADAGALLDAILHHDPIPFLEPDPRIPDALKDICRTLLEKEAEARYESSAALITALEAFRQAEGNAVGAAALRDFLQDPDAYRAAVRRPLLAAATPPQVRIVTASAQAEEEAAPAPPPSALQEPPAGGSMPSAAPLPDRPGLIALKRSWRRVLTVVLFMGVVSALAYAAGIASMDGRPPSTSPPAAEADMKDAPEHGESREGEGLLQEAPPADRAETPPVARPGPDAEATRPPQQEEELREPAAPLRSPRARPRAEDVQAAEEAAAGEALGTLRVAVHPYAEVFIGGTSHGTIESRVQALSLPPGRYTVEMRHPQFPTYSTTVDVDPGQETELKVSLLEQFGLLKILVSTWADVFIDAQHRGQTPLSHPIALKAGRHVLTLRNSVARIDTTLAIDVRAGETRELRFMFDK